VPEKAESSHGAGKRAKPAAARTRRRRAAEADTPQPVVAAPAEAPAPAGAAPGRLRVRQVRSGIGHAARYRRTLEALGLKHHQDEVIVRDHPAIRGMLRKVWHLVSVHPVED
jgi:large subunit ribosomal protein L30